VRQYREHFTSFDGKNRSFIVEASGDRAGHEYNVLTGLSYATAALPISSRALRRTGRARIAWALRRVRLQDFSSIVFGAFLNARGFQETPDREFL